MFQASGDHLVGQYDLPLVVLSVVISIFASYAALDLAGRVTVSRGRARLFWLTGGATAMGIGIWAMHYVGMLAFRLPVPVLYDWPLVLLSLLAAVAASGVALFVVSRPHMGVFRACVGSIFMGSGISAMHYIGMAAMRMPAMCVYVAPVLALSVALAIAISFVALWLSFHSREAEANQRLKSFNALVMGAAIPVMHYTGMSAAVFTSAPLMAQDLQHAVSVSSLGLAVIVGVTLCALGVVLLTATAERRISVHVTGRERAEEKLRNTEDQMRFALDAAGVGTWETDLTTGQGEWSPRLQALHGVTGSAFPNGVDSFLEHVHWDDRAMVKAEMDQAIRNRRDWSVIYRTVWPDGSVHAVNEIGRAFYDEAGTPVRTAGVGIDVTERQRLEMHLRQAQKMEAIGKLAGGVAHDFNNLLTAIIAFSQMARAQLDAAHPAWADIGEVLKAADSAGSLTRQLLAFSRMQMLRPQVLDLNAVVTRLEAILRRTIGDDTRLVMQLDPQVDHVNADPGQVEQVVMNLVVNARDAMPQGGTITIATANVTLDRTYVATHPGSSAGPQVMIAITDTGSGITEAVKARLFEPFFTTKEQGHGTGLGLATVYGIVKQSGGFIWVDTQVGRGSTFRVYLPRTERDLEAAETTVRVAEGGTETILLVEDQEQVRAAVNAMLTRSGYAVLSAASGDAALRLAEQHPASIDLLLTDVVMPGINGPDLARALLRRRPDVRVLFTSGYIDRAVVREAVIEPGLRFIQKPFSQASLLREVRLTLDAPPSTASVSR